MSHESKQTTNKKPRNSRFTSSTLEAVVSGTSSLALHSTFFVVLALLGSTRGCDRAPTSLVDLGETIEVIPDATSVANVAKELDEFTESRPLTSSEPNDPLVTQTTVPQAQFDDVKVDNPGITSDVDKTIDNALRAAAAKEAEAVANVNRAKDALAQTQQGNSSAGGSSSGGTRASRWVMQFNTLDARHYLDQLASLEAEIAFPLEGGQWRYFTNLAGRPPDSITKDLSNENRIYWVDERSHAMMGEELKVRNAPMMAVFFPKHVEEDLVQKELAYARRSNPRAQERDIEQTVFQVREAGGRFEAEVASQRP